MTQKVYLNGRILPVEDASISPYDRGFNFADGVYEVVRSYSGHLFYWDAHMERLKYSLREVNIPCDTVSEFGSIAKQLLDENGLRNAEATIYIQITRGAAPRSHRYDNSKMDATVLIACSGFTPHTREQEDGVAVILEPDQRWSRCDIKSIGLLPNILALQKATDMGYAEALLVRDGSVLEGSHSNFFAVSGSTVMTPPLSHYILPGITRNIIIDLCRSRGIALKELPISEKDIYKADELMITGTTTEITPVVRVNDHLLSGGRPGEITRRLQQEYERMRQVLVAK